MGGFKIGIGVGLKYSTPINVKCGSVSPPEPQISTVMLTENSKAVLSEDSKTIKTEGVNAIQPTAFNVSTTNATTKAKTTKKKQVDKSYWNF